MRIRLLPLAAVMVSFAVICSPAATTRYVNLNCTSPVAPYTSWATAATNIQDAVNSAGTGDLVLVTNGVYQTGGNAATARLTIVPAITVQSVNGAAMTTIDGAGVMRCVMMSSGVKLLGFMLANGAAGTHSGGGVYGLAPDFFVANCIFTNNSAVTGGGAQSGTFSNCTFIANVATNYGGGVYGATNYQCSFVGNSAGYNGGGAFRGMLVNCSLAGNSVGSSGWGGGASLGTLINCVLTGNRAGYIGGGASGCMLFNCTVASNQSGAYDAGVSGCAVDNSIVYYNTAYYTTTPMDDSGSSYFTNCCRFPQSTFELANVNTVTNPPVFVNPAAGNFHLQSSSPCINAGNNSYITNATDLDGNPRIFGGTVDIGAYEYHPAVLYVSVTNTAPVSPYTNWTTAATNIQDAIDAANAGDSIVVCDGLYNTGGRVVYNPTTNRVVLNKAVTVQSINGPGPTIIAGFGAGPPIQDVRCAYLTNGASLIGFTLTNGWTVPYANSPVAESGGGVWCEGNGATISNCVLAGNLAVAYGGGAFRGTLLNCIFTNNSGGFGGAAASNVLINCTLIKNIANQQNFNSGGGAFFCTLSNCLVVGNVCNGGRGGGGAYFSTLTGCVVSNNTAFNGGGVCFGVVNCSLISSNRVTTYGGGAYSNILNNCVLKNNFTSGNGAGAFGSVLVNCTVVSNSTPGNSGGAGGFDGGSASNSIIYYNFSGKGPNFLNSQQMYYCCTTPLPESGVGNITNEPVFVNLTGGDFHLQSNSPCINAGNNAFVTVTNDLDGNPRIVGGTVDAGAYEFQSPSSIISYAWLQQYGLPINGSADNLDSDGDGFKNWQEWVAGTDPTSASSLLQTTSVTPTNNFSGATITWQSVSGVNYFVQSGSDLGAPLLTIATNIAGHAGTTSYTDTNAVGGGPFFYRIGAAR